MAKLFNKIKANEDDVLLDSTEKTVLSIGEFNYNEYGVCLNPAQVLEVAQKGKISYELEVCENKKGWTYSVSYNCNSSLVGTGGGSRGGFLDGHTYPKKESAIVAGATYLIETFDRYLKEVKQLEPQRKRLDPLLKIIVDNNKLLNTNDMPKKNSLTAELDKPYVRPLMDEPEQLGKEQSISLAILSPNNTNPRKTYSKENIKEMADSMLPPIGLLHAITVRPMADGFEIVFGWRRYLAAVLLKWETIPAIVKNYTDEQMLEIQMIEYLQREDINPLDEAHAFKDLLKKENIDWLATRIHKTKKYISDRLKLNDLVPEAAGFLARGVLPLGHAVVISKMPFADQKACLTKCISNGFAGSKDSYCKLALEDLKEFVAEDIMLEFTRASFNTEDPLLYPAAGPCTTCPKRTSNSNLLFNDITSADKCTDAACFNEKIKLNIEAAKEKGKKEYGKVLSGEKNSYGSRNEIKVQGVVVPIQEKPNKNSIPVVITKVNSFSDKKGIGTTVYVDKNKVDLVKHEKEEKKLEKKTVTQHETYEQRQLRELTELWPRVEFAVKNTKPFPAIIKDFFSGKLSEIDDYILFGFAGLAKIIPEVSTPDQAIAAVSENLIDKIIDQYSADELIMISSLLSQVDGGYSDGLSWEEMVKEINPGKVDKKGVKSLIEKIK